MSQYGCTIPRRGRALIAKVLAEKMPLKISRIMMGSGVCPDEIFPGDLEDLVEPVVAGTSTEPTYDGDTVHMMVEYRSDLNGGLDRGFWIREFGVFAKDLDGTEVMLYYGTLGDYPQWVSAYSEQGLDTRRYPVDITIGEGTTVIIDYSPEAFMTSEDVKSLCMTTVLPQFLTQAQGLIDAHNTDANAHAALQNNAADINKRLALLELMYALGKCLRSIYYEIDRGLCVQRTTDYEFVERYSPEQAERKYREFLKEKGPELKIGHDHALVKKLEELIMEQKFSPGAALAYIKNGAEKFDTEICETTLYNYIYRGDVFLVLNEKHLYEKGRRHYAEKSKKKAARAPRGESIENRPKEIGKREKFGHWEMDSIIGCKGSKQALLVLTERKTRMGIIILVEDHTAESVVKAINRLERKFGKLFYTLFKSITVDNGCEFQDFEAIEIAHRRKGKRTIVFFCHPYSAYERGSNENMNRLIRRFFPKGTNFDEVTKEQVKEAERWVNNYPRKLLGWKSAADLFEEEVQAA